MEKKMMHEDWLYLIEFFLKREDTDTAEELALNMKRHELER